MERSSAAWKVRAKSTRWKASCIGLAPIARVWRNRSTRPRRGLRAWKTPTKKCRAGWSPRWRPSARSSRGTRTEGAPCGASAMVQVNVTINDKHYRMACDDGEEAHLAGLAERLNASIEALRERFGEIGD